MSLLFSFFGRIGRGGFWLGVLAQMLIGILALVLIYMMVPFDQMLVKGADGQPVLDALGQPQIDFNNPAMMPAFIIYGIAGLLSLWISLATAVKRMHDRGRTGWLVLPMYLLMLVLVGVIWWLVDLGILEGQEGPNKYGPDPRATTA